MVNWKSFQISKHWSNDCSLLVPVLLLYLVQLLLLNWKTNPQITFRKINMFTASM